MHRRKDARTDGCTLKRDQGENRVPLRCYIGRGTKTAMSVHVMQSQSCIKSRTTMIFTYFKVNEGVKTMDNTELGNPFSPIQMVEPYLKAEWSEDNG